MVFHSPGANYPMMLAISLQRKGDYYIAEGTRSVVKMHFVRLDSVPQEFGDVFAQPVYGRMWRVRRALAWCWVLGPGSWVK